MENEWKINFSYYNHWSLESREFFVMQQNWQMHSLMILLCIKLLGGNSDKESACKFRRCKRCRFDSGLGRYLGGGHGNPFQYSCLENLMHRRVWKAIVPRAAKSQTQLRDLAHTWKYKALSFYHGLLRQFLLCRDRYLCRDSRRCMYVLRWKYGRWQYQRTSSTGWH